MNDDSGRGSTDSDSFDALLARAARVSPARGTSSPAVQLHPGSLLSSGRFRLLRRIGAGGMGVVFEAFDQDRGTEVAVKTLARVDAHGIYRFKNEFRALADVLHPNLVRLHDLFVEGQLWLFSMELVRGVDLDTWVRPKHDAELTRVRSAFSQVAHGVRAIHDAGKLHRDLKPSNVLVETSGGRVVILDFGLISDPESGLPRGTAAESGALGTPHYMAPEQAAGRTATNASDLYALGVMLFEALTGKLPFDGRVHTILDRKQHEDAPRARALAPAVPQALDDLCAALLDRSPGRRPDIATVLQKLGDGSGRVGVSTPPSAAFSGSSLRTLIGRDDELARLREARESTRAGTPVVLRVSGESGIGKSALVEAFLQPLRTRGEALVLSGRCYERESVPYKALDRVVDQITSHLRDLPRADLDALLPPDFAALSQVFPVLARVRHDAAALGITGSEAGELRRRAFDALGALLSRLHARTPLVIYIDDMHWLDADSALLLEHVLGQAAAPAGLWVFTERRAGEHTLLNDALARIPAERMAVRTLELEPLSAAACAAMASDLVQDAALAARIAQEARGNPFFVSELARMRHPTLAEHEPLELSLERAVRERVSELGEVASALLAVLAVAARPTPTEVLVRAAGPWDDPHRALDNLRSSHLIREAGKRHHDCYHDRIRDAVNGGLQPTSLRILHRKLAQAWSEHSTPDPELLYTHWRGAGELELAGRHAVAAADRASASLAFGRCAMLLTGAIETLPAEEVAALGLRARRAEALSLAGRWADASVAYRDAGDHASDPSRRNELAFFSALHALGAGHGQTALPQLRGLFERSGIRWPRTRWGAFLAGAVRLGWAVLRADRWLGSARRGGTLPDAVELMRWLGSAGFVPAYDLPRGLYFMSVFIGRALRSGDPAFSGIALAMVAGLLSASKYTQPRARELSKRAVEIARSHDQHAIASATLSFVAYGHLLDGRPSQTLAFGHEAEKRASTQGSGPAYPAWAARAAQAYALLWMGRLVEADALFERNSRFASESGDELAAVGGDCALRHLARGDLAGATTLMERKARLLDALGARGSLRELYDRERVFCMLYEGRGAEAVANFVTRGSVVALFDPGMPLALAMLQADPEGRNKRTKTILNRTRAHLRAHGEAAPSQAMEMQLAASLLHIDGDVAGCIAALQRAEGYYTAGEMELHAAMMRYRRAQLSGETDTADRAQAEIGALGVRDSARWLAMLTPGLTPGGPARAGRLQS